MRNNFEIIRVIYLQLSAVSYAPRQQAAQPNRDLPGKLHGEPPSNEPSTRRELIVFYKVVIFSWYFYVYLLHFGHLLLGSFLNGPGKTLTVTIDPVLS